MWGIEEVPNVVIVPIRLPEENLFGELKSLARVNRNRKLAKACEILRKTLGFTHAFPKPGEICELVELCTTDWTSAILVKNGKAFVLPWEEMPKDSSMYEKLIKFLKS